VEAKTMTNYDAVYQFHRLHNESIGGQASRRATAYAREAANHWRRRHRDVADEPFRGRLETVPS